MIWKSRGSGCYTLKALIKGANLVLSLLLLTDQPLADACSAVSLRALPSFAEIGQTRHMCWWIRQNLDRNNVTKKNTRCKIRDPMSPKLWQWGFKWDIIIKAASHTAPFPDCSLAASPPLLTSDPWLVVSRIEILRIGCQTNALRRNQ